MASNPYDQPFAKSSRFASGNTTFYSKATGRGATALNKSRGAVKNPFDQQFNATGDAPNQDYSKQGQQSQPQQTATKSQPKQQQQQQPKQSLFSKITSAVVNDAKKAGAAVVKPVADVVTGKGGKAVHDTAQLASDVTGGTSSYVGANAANITKITAAHISGNKTALANAKAASRQNLGLDNNGNITKKSLIKAGANVANTALTLAGGGEAKALISGAKQGAKVVGKRVAKDATLGSGFGAAQTYAQNPGATAKEVAKNAAVGAVVGGVIPVAVKGTEIAASKVASSKAGQAILDKVDSVKPNIKATKDLVTNTKTNALLHAVEPAKTAGMDTNTKIVLNTLMSKLHTPKSVIEDAKAQADNTAAAQKAADDTAKQVQKDVETSKKLDNQIELVNAKKADGKFTNVDKVKVKQLEDQKKALNIPTGQTSELATTPKAELSNEAIPEQTPAPRGSSQSLSESVTPSIKVFGKTIPMTEENGFKASAAKDGGMVYQKTTMRGNNARGDRQAITHYYTADGKNITQTQHDAMVKGELATPKTDKPPTYIQQTYKPSATTTKDEQFAANYLHENHDQALADYHARTQQEFGNNKNNIVSGDESKFIIPGFGADKSQSYHEAASAFAKAHYKALLADESTKDRPVMIMAGGSGAGKTTALRKVADNPLDGFAAVVDTNLPDMKSAESRIQQARTTGRPVEINYVYRDPKEAYANGVIPRAVRTGRTVTDRVHATTHAGSLDTIKKLVEKYKDDPNVNINVIDNSLGRDKQELIPEAKVLDFLNKRSYTKEQIHADAHEALNSAVKNGEITNEQKINFIEQQGARSKDSAVAGKQSEKTDQKAAVKEPKISARKESEYKPSKEEPVNVPYEQSRGTPITKIQTSKLAQGVETNAIKKGLADGFEGKAEYAKINIDQQTKAATDLLKADPERAVRIAMGNERPPEGLLPESTFIAVENAATKSGNIDLLRQLATESHLTSEASGMGQRIRMLGEREGTSVVSAIKQVKDTRVAAAEKRLGKPVTKAVSDEVKQIRATKPKVTKETWSDFVSSLKC